MQRHEVPLHGTESWGGGGWGRTARYESSGGVVPSRASPGAIRKCAGILVATGRSVGATEARATTTRP